MGVVATDDALDIGIHPISPRSEITPADTFSNHPHLHSKPLHRPLSLPRSTILSKRLTRAHHCGRHLSGLFDQKIPNTARIPDKYAPQFVDFQQMCSNMGEARHQICPDLILHVDSPWTLAISIWPGVLIKYPKLHANPASSSGRPLQTRWCATACAGCRLDNLDNLDNWVE